MLQKIWSGYVHGYASVKLIWKRLRVCSTSVQLEVGDTGSFTFMLSLATSSLMLKTVAKNMVFYFRDNSIFTRHTPVLNNQTLTYPEREDARESKWFPFRLREINLDWAKIYCLLFSSLKSLTVLWVCQLIKLMDWLWFLSLCEVIMVYLN